MAVSPDNRYLIEVSESADASGGSPVFQIWRTATSGEGAIPLTRPSPNVTSQGSWSPDGHLYILQYDHPFVLAPSTENASLGDVRSTSLLAVLPDGRTTTLQTHLGGVFGSNILGWLAAGTFADAATTPSGTQPGEAAPVDSKLRGLQLDPSAPASPDDRYVILRDPGSGSPIVWDRTGDTGRRLPTGTVDLSWLPQSQVLVGVGTASGGPPGALNRLVSFATTFGSVMPNYDFRAYDPAGIGSATAERYAEPLFSPDENALAFFVIDDRGGSVALWLADYGGQARMVYQWSVPGNSRIDVSPVAAWIDSSTLIFAEPGDWHDGLPRQVRLRRLTLDGDGAPQVATLTTLHTHGNEHGVDLRELAINLASGHIAYRLRHFTQASPTSGIFDSVDVVAFNHVDSPIELSRQGSGSGLSWSPDGHVLAATFPGELRFFSGSGDLLGTVSGLADPSSPRWVSPTEVWFQTTQDGTEQIMSVPMH